MDTARHLAHKLQKELNSGVIALVLLATLDRSGKAMYGYQICKHLRELGNDGLPMHQGAVYPVLRSLESFGLLRSAIEASPTGPPRKYYTITANGRRVLEKWIDTWQATSGFVEAAIWGRSWKRRRKSI